MTINLPKFTLVSILLLSIALLGACKKEDENSQAPKIADKNTVGCLAANDFYAVHFSAYLQPSVELKNLDRTALLKPFCKELPAIGKVFFSADLIDSDIRETPIAIRLAEFDANADLAQAKELRTVAEFPAKTYPKGVVEAQASIDKDGYYALILLVGDAKTEDDRLKIPFHVGGNPYNPYGWPHETWLAIISGIILAILGIISLVYRWVKKRKLRNA